MEIRRQEHAMGGINGKQRRDGEGNRNFENVCERAGGRGVGRKGRFTFPVLRHKGARLSETAGKEEEKNGKARPEQVAERRAQKNKEKGNGGVFWPR